MRRRDLWIAALLSSVTIAGCARTKADQKEPAYPEVLVTSPTTDEITEYEEFIGHTDAVFTVEIRARVSGYLDKVNFNDGDEIEKGGALLFQIDERPYKAEFDRTMATLEQGKARLTRLAADHNRAVHLRERNAIGQEEFDLITGNFKEGQAAIGVYTAALDRAKLDLDFTKVIAPIGGRLSRRMVDPGNLVQADVTPLTTIVSLDPMYVYFDIDERTMLKLRRLIAEGKIKSRLEAEVPVLVGLSDEKDFPHRGIVNFSDNKVDSSTGTLRIRGSIANPKPRLLSPGLFARIRLPVGTSKKSLLINEQAIASEQNSKYVYVVRKSKVKVKDKQTKKEKEVELDVAFAQPIKVGILNNGLRVVDKGLEEGDKVIISGLQRVKTGDPVVIGKQKAPQPITTATPEASAPSKVVTIPAPQPSAASEPAK